MNIDNAKLIRINDYYNCAMICITMPLLEHHVSLNNLQIVKNKLFEISISLMIIIANALVLVIKCVISFPFIVAIGSIINIPYKNILLFIASIVIFAAKCFIADAVDIIISKNILSSYTYKIAKVMVFWAFDFGTNIVSAATNKKGLDGIRKEMNERFDVVDKKFVTVDERFNAVDERFNAVDERFNTMDKKLDAIMNILNEHFGYSTISIPTDAGESDGLEFHYSNDDQCRDNYIHKRR